MRRLEVTFAGYWYTALTIGLGVIALVTGNNVLYLIESLLLSAMIFSGVLSERSISALEVEFRRSHACAGSPAGDVIRLRNRKRYSLFCLEVGEWRDGEFVSAAFISRLGSRAEALVSSNTHYPKRGKYSWQGIAVATSYPFGLARKIRVIENPGERLIWPERGSARAKSLATGDRGSGIRHGQEFAEGEVRSYTFEDDCRDIVWTLSEKGMGPLVRTRKARQTEASVVLDLRSEAGESFECAVTKAAQVFHRHTDAEGSLTLIDHQGSRIFHGKVTSLNQLATVQAQGAHRAHKAHGARGDSAA